MKKLIAIVGFAGLALAGIINAQNLTTNADGTLTTNAPVVVVTAVTNVTVNVQPVMLSATQMDGIIQLIQASGITANAQITSSNLNSLSISRFNDGFMVLIKVK
jgi:hypothetical protein